MSWHTYKGTKGKWARKQAHDRKRGQVLDCAQLADLVPGAPCSVGQAALIDERAQHRYMAIVGNRVGSLHERFDFDARRTGSSCFGHGFLLNVSCGRPD